MNKREILQILLIILILGSFNACTKDEFTDSIFDTNEKVLDPTSASYQLDKFLYDNYLLEYNLDFKYKMEDIGVSKNYNLVPATYDKSVDLAILTKYLWFDAYAQVAGKEFLQKYGPRIILLIGSAAMNPAHGTMIVGLAEGGIKVSLLRVNALDPSSADALNELYFKTMHHEFAHILHQTKTYPKEFNLISSSYYEPLSWQSRDNRVVASLGFTSSYGSSQTREDFVETIANYITKTDAQWSYWLDIASKNWVVHEGVLIEGTDADSDGVDGYAVILQKLNIAREWLRDAWQVDLDALRAEVQRRQANIDMNELRKQVYGIE